MQSVGPLPQNRTPVTSSARGPYDCPKIITLAQLGPNWQMLEVCEIFTVSRSQIPKKFPISVFARVCEFSVGLETNAYVNEIRL